MTRKPSKISLSAKGDRKNTFDPVKSEACKKMHSEACKMMHSSMVNTEPIPETIHRIAVQEGGPGGAGEEGLAP
jgi:hypothetical protein